MRPGSQPPPAVHGQPSLPTGHSGPGSTHTFDRHSKPASHALPAHGQPSVPGEHPASAVPLVSTVVVAVAVDGPEVSSALVGSVEGLVPVSAPVTSPLADSLLSTVGEDPLAVVFGAVVTYGSVGSTSPQPCSEPVSSATARRAGAIGSRRAMTKAGRAAGGEHTKRVWRARQRARTRLVKGPGGPAVGRACGGSRWSSQR